MKIYFTFCVGIFLSVAQHESCEKKRKLDWRNTIKTFDQKKQNELEDCWIFVALLMKFNTNLRPNKPNNNSFNKSSHSKYCLHYITFLNFLRMKYINLTESCKFISFVVIDLFPGLPLNETINLMDDVLTENHDDNWNVFKFV